MRVYLDETLVGEEQPSLDLALRAGASAAEARGRIVIEANADGVSLTDEQLAGLAGDCASIREVHLRTSDPYALVQVTLLDACEALGQARIMQTAAADLIQAGKPDQAMPKLQEALATWQAICDVVEKSAKVLRINLDALSLPDASGEPQVVGKLFGELTDRLVDVKRGVVHEDWAALADTLAYDLDAQANSWNAMLRALADHVRAGRGGLGEHARQ
jgi:hypothetical protein